MSRLNYHHLLYFWTVAKEGSIAAACKRLHLTQPTISAQLRTLERQLGHALFERKGRRLVLTEAGRTAFRHADGIFALGHELLDALAGRGPGAPLRFQVGIADVVPKLVVWKLLAPALSVPEPMRFVCVEGNPNELLAKLAVHELDVVLTDLPLAPHQGLQAFSHRLGESSITAFGTAALHRKHRRGFPGSLDGAPVLLPTQNTLTRRLLEHWFESKRIRPRVVGEFEDSALLKVFGEAGTGLFFAPTVIAPAVENQYRVRRLGRLDGPTEQFYAISMERKMRHPALQAMSAAARAGWPR